MTPFELNRGTSLTKIRVLALAALLLSGMICPVALSQPSEKAPQNVSEIASAAQPIHAVWVESMSADVRTRRSCENLINHLRDSNVDDVFVEVRSMGDAYYRTNLAPTAMGLPAEFQDPLGTLLEAARRPGSRPLRIHAVLDLFRVFSDAFPLPAPKEHLLNLHPEWLMRDDMGNTRDKNRNTYLDPGVPAVQDYLTSVVAELVTRYPVDGVHFSNFSYPGGDTDWGYNSMAIQRFQIDTGATTEKPEKDAEGWVRWRTGQLTQLLGRLSGVVRSTTGSMTVSVSAIAVGAPPEGKLGEKTEWQKGFQDWPRWCSNGSIDWVVLEDFQPQDTQARRFADWIDFGRKTKDKSKLIVAVSGGMNMDSGVLMQLRLAVAREADGVLLYSYEKPAMNLAKGADYLDLLGKTVFSPNYVLPNYVHEAILSELPTALPAPEPVDIATPIDLPPPVPLEEAAPTPVVESTPLEPQFQQSDAGRALLGLGGKPTLVRPGTREPENARDIPPVPEADFVGSGWLKVKLKNGQSFVGQKLESDRETTVFQVRNRSAKLTLKNTQIAETTPYAPAR